MKLAGREVLALPRALVWRGLNDPEILKSCIPGCHFFRREEPLRLRAQMTAKLGFLRLNVAVQITQSEVIEPVSCRLDVVGEGTFAAMGQAIALVQLVEISAAETAVEFSVEAQLGGKLAVLGQSLVDTAAQGYVSRFFARFDAALRGLPALHSNTITQQQ